MSANVSQNDNLKKDSHLVRRLFFYLKQHKALFLGALLLYPVSALAIVLPPYLVQQILDVAIPTQNMDLLYGLAGAYMGALLVDYIAGFTSQFAMSVLGQRSMRSLRKDLFAHMQKLPQSYFDVNPIGRTLTRVTNDVESLAEIFATGAVTIIADLITIVAIVSAMLYLDVGMTLYAFVVVPPLIAVTIFVQRIAREAFRAVRRHLSRINTFLSEYLPGMGVVQAFAQEARTIAKFNEFNLAYRNANHKAIRLDASLFAIVEAMGTVAVAVLVWYGAEDLAQGAVRAGVLVAFIQYIRRFFIPIRDLSAKYTVLQSAFAGAERVFKLLEEPITLDSKDNAQAVEPLNEGLCFESVSFAYKEGEEGPDWVLRDVNLTIKPGEKVALVGPTGSGKTTILKLLNRLYDVQEGRVTYNGVDVRDLDLVQLRQRFAVVLQDVYLFSGNLQDNLQLTKGVSQEKVLEAARIVQAAEFIERLPEGYLTEVKELGANFSAGERQLLAFARALALDPDILVLDEATSNVDSQTEARLQHALDILLENRTALVVAHRLSTIRKVDRIIVLQHGKIVQEGNHDQLMREGGLYRQLAELQFGQPKTSAVAV